MYLLSHILLAAAWLFYVFVHSLLASLQVKSFIHRLVGDHYFRYYRLAYSCFAFITLAITMLYQFSIESIILWNPSIPVRLMGILLSLGGLAVMAACIKKYFMNLSGVDVLTKHHRDKGLEENGLHSYVRHPLYSGTLLFIWSLFIIFPFLDNLIAVVLITSYTLIGITIEERKLLIEYGESYRNYSGRIPMLIPSFSKILRLKRRYI